MLIMYKRIKERENERGKYEKRWLWELIQNAKDSVGLSEKVNIKIGIKENTLSFEHSGNPFELDDILALLIQGSSKEEGDGKTGRFGTGFITTYLLSKTVNITGKLTNKGGYFDFCLNRDTADIKEFRKLQELSNKNFCTSIQAKPYIQGEYQTRFVYHLDKNGKDTAKKGLGSLNKLIPFVQSFNTQIGSITIDNNGEATTYKKKDIDKYEINGEKIEEWEFKTSNSENALRSYVIRNDRYIYCACNKNCKQKRTIY